MIPLLRETLTGEALTQEEQQKEIKFNDKVKSEFRGAREVSKAFIIVRFGLGPSNQLNSTPGLALCHVATMACTDKKPHSNQQLNVVMAVIKAL